MNIIVCVKQVFDPEIPPSKFHLDAKAMKVIPPEGIPPVINPYDAQAVELALRLKEQNGGKITVLTLGGADTASVVKHALSMGADDGIVLSDAAFEGSDSFGIAYILSMAIQKVGGYELILFGRQAADWDEGIVGSIVAEYLNLPLVTLAEAIEVNDTGIKVRRAILDGYQVFSASLPAVVTVSNEVGQPRLPSGWGIIAAARKQIQIWNTSNLDVDVMKVGSAAGRRKLFQLFAPERARKCEIISAETVSEAAVRLADRLREKGII